MGASLTFTQEAKTVVTQTAKWTTNAEGHEILQMVKMDDETEKVLWYFRRAQVRDAEDAWFVYEYGRYKGVQPDAQGRWVGRVVYEGDLAGACEFMQEKEASILRGRRYDVSAVLSTAQEIIERCGEMTLIDKEMFDKVAADVCHTLITLVQGDDESPDDDFINFVECYLYR